ncbi:hypothetical protein [Paraburkholderia acidipaludis]|uniref:hypothetical protein n=1 Tax=Paraburkholderia acidipaludis TaxID=660537 RepID=UPI000484AB37|nr:hypothetical protein [Paraburkholderia acidipaludis]
MEFLLATGYMLVAMMILLLFALADWSARNNLPPTLRHEVEKIMADYGRVGNHPVCTGRNSDTVAVHQRGAECIKQSL